MTLVDTPLTGDWPARLQRAHAAYPSAAQPIGGDATARIVNGEEVLARILRDVLAVDNVTVRRGQRPDPDVDDGRQLLLELRGLDYTVDPFHIALRALAAGRSLENLRRRTGLSRATLSRLMNTSKPKPPRVDEMEAVAAGFGKRPVYFAEYRSAVLAAIVQQHFTQDPDRSAVVTYQLGLGR